jgi:hypothetical protein
MSVNLILALSRTSLSRQDPMVVNIVTRSKLVCRTVPGLFRALGWTKLHHQSPGSPTKFLREVSADIFVPPENLQK